jgi:hypothetical protein
VPKIIFLVLISITATPVMAGWTGCWLFENPCRDYEIAHIFRDVAEANKVLDNNKPVMQQLLDQRTHWEAYTGKSTLITEGIIDVLEKLPPERDRFLKFVGSPKCTHNTKCYNFQTDLISYFNDLTDLNQDFPALKKAGLGNRQLVTKAILRMPPLMLYALYRSMENVPDWRSLPKDLRDIFDEIDDPDVFNMDLKESSVQTSFISSSPNRASRISAFRDTTKTQRFCANKADKFDGTGRGRNGNRDGWDQIRINRITLYFTLIADSWKWGVDMVPDDIDIGVSLVGEGGYLGIPSVVFTWMFKIVPLALESILKALEVHHKNIDLCRSRFAEIESRLASCKYFTEFVLDGAARDEYYQLVQRRFDMADAAGISHAQSDAAVSRSYTKLDQGKYAQSYEQLCEAYSSIGIAN